MSDISVGQRSGIDVRAYPDGIVIGGWYDTYVGIEGAFVSWEQLDDLRRKARRRKAFRDELRHL